MTMRFGIIGAGIAGLTLATRLVEADHSALLLDKGRGIGGRVSTRRGVGVAFDHGAQYFTCRDPRFRAFLDDHVPEADRAVWEARFATYEDSRLVEEVIRSPRLVGVPGMSSVARAIGRGLEIRTGARVVRVAGSPGRWTLVDAEGREEGPFDWVVSTVPPAQAVAILDGLSPIATDAGRVEMQPCFALLIAPTNGASLPFDGIRCRHPVLGWAANDHSKPGRGAGPALVIHSDHDWASAHRDDDPKSVAEVLLRATNEAFGVDLATDGSESVHRWLYAKPRDPLGRACLIDEEARLAACGDWCLAGKVEGAFLSGDACSSAILSGKSSISEG